MIDCNVLPSQRIIGGILGLIVGDACGVPLEFCSREDLRRFPVYGMRGWGTHHQPAGTWSDDAAMCLAHMQAFIRHGWDPHEHLQAFSAWYHEGLTAPTVKPLISVSQHVYPCVASAMADHSTKWVVMVNATTATGALCACFPSPVGGRNHREKNLLQACQAPVRLPMPMSVVAWPAHYMVLSSANCWPEELAKRRYQLRLRLSPRLFQHMKWKPLNPYL